MWEIFFIFVPHTPDIFVKESKSLSLVWCCCNSKSPLCIAPNLHILAVCSWVKAFRTQDTWIDVKSPWISRKWSSVHGPCQTGQIIRQAEFRMCSVGVQIHRSWWDKTIKIDVHTPHIHVINTRRYFKDSPFWTISRIFSQTPNARFPKWFATLIRTPDLICGSWCGLWKNILQWVWVHKQRRVTGGRTLTFPLWL